MIVSASDIEQYEVLGGCHPAPRELSNRILSTLVCSKAQLPVGTVCCSQELVSEMNGEVRWDRHVRKRKPAHGHGVATEAAAAQCDLEASSNGSHLAGILVCQRQYRNWIGAMGAGWELVLP